jgi:hypothetical protein
MKVPLGPSRHLESPALGEMLAGGADPGINQRIADRLGSYIEAVLLSHLFGVIKIELINKLIERSGKFTDLIDALLELLS